MSGSVSDLSSCKPATQCSTRMCMKNALRAILRASRHASWGRCSHFNSDTKHARSTIDNMDHRSAGRYWERNAAAWTKLARGGWDVYRDALNSPAFFELLPDVAGKSGLDAGCGDGNNTRLLAQRGASMVGLDIAPTFVRLARDAERA